MEEVSEGSAAPPWPDVAKLQCHGNQLPMSTTAMIMFSNSGFFEHQNNVFKSSMSRADDFASSSLLGENAHHHHHHPHHQPEDTLLAAHLKQDSRLENVDSFTQSNGVIQPLHQEFSQVRPDTLQTLLRGSLKLPKLERSPSIGSSGSEKPLSHTYQSVLALPNGGGVFSSSFPSGVFNANSPLHLEGTHYFAQGPWIDEAHNAPLERRFHLSEQTHGQHARSSSQQSVRQPHGAAASASVPARPRTRARRGQATDPHSIAERKRREKITNAVKELKELVPTLNKADRIAFVEDVIEYVRFLQLQTKVFIMNRLSNPGASLVVAEAVAQGQEGPASSDLQEYNMATIEEEIARLLEEDMGEALRSLQSKGLCMMPVSLASVMPIHDTKQPSGLANSIISTPTHTRAH